jgi:hypothetical protein
MFLTVVYLLPNALASQGKLSVQKAEWERNQRKVRPGIRPLRFRWRAHPLHNATSRLGEVLFADPLALMASLPPSRSLATPSGKEPGRGLEDRDGRATAHVGNQRATFRSFHNTLKGLLRPQDQPVRPPPTRDVEAVEAGTAWSSDRLAGSSEVDSCSAWLKAAVWPAHHCHPGSRPR